MKPTVMMNQEETSKEELKNKKAERKMKRLMEYLQGVQDQNFTGYIKVNFSEGSVGRIEKFEEILKK
ncbi:MAG: hypothetical protein V2B19_04870 [Pseudomonadota bacterium]